MIIKISTISLSIYGVSTDCRSAVHQPDDALPYAPEIVRQKVDYLSDAPLSIAVGGLLRSGGGLFRDQLLLLLFINIKRVLHNFLLLFLFIFIFILIDVDSEPVRWPRDDSLSSWSCIISCPSLVMAGRGLLCEESSSRQIEDIIINQPLYNHSNKQLRLP